LGVQFIINMLERYLLISSSDAKVAPCYIANFLCISKNDLKFAIHK